jgi:hypothetical protein
VSHCTLHRSILQVALKCADLDITHYLGQFLTLGAKVPLTFSNEEFTKYSCVYALLLSLSMKFGTYPKQNPFARPAHGVRNISSGL